MIQARFQTELVAELSVGVLASLLPNAWGASDWLWPLVALLAVGLAVIIWSYTRAQASHGLRAALVILKFVALALLAICLLEPSYRHTRPERGANLMVVMADDSQSLQIKDRGKSETREFELKQKLTNDSGWLIKLAEDFDVRRYQFDRRLRPVAHFKDYAANERGSDIVNNIKIVSSRFSGRPSAGIVLMTDGNVTAATASDLDSIDWENTPPIYPVVLGESSPARDLGITQVTSTQTNFESAPVTVTAELMAHGYQGKRVSVQLLNQQGEEIERKEVKQIEDGRPFAVRFQTRPTRPGVNVYQVKAFASDEESSTASADTSVEATIVNNQRLAIVDRGSGPFRILYVSGRPNWELKFLRRATQDDEELDLVGLVRIAKREAKFTFRGRDGQQSNSLFRGFESQDEDTTEQHDEPVFLRLGTRDESELLGGFPKDAETLFGYDAVVIDDLEAAFFSEDQKTLLHQFVSRRGGGLLMLGGQESFGSGDYDKTQIGEMLPIYLDRVAPEVDAQYQLGLTRDGWLQPWVRIESTEDKENQRLVSMPKFKTLNVADSIKPGATVLATVATNEGTQHPALVVQPFGKGRVGALMIGDFWRWQLNTEDGNDDLMKAWRQMMRWVVSDVPRRIDCKIEKRNDTNRTTEMVVTVRDESYRLLDNATVEFEITTPDGKMIELTGVPSGNTPGEYRGSFVSIEPGAYSANVLVAAADGTEIGEVESGWVSEPDSEEFQSLEPNRKFLELLAEKSGGEVIELDGLTQFVNSLDYREVPISETSSLPWWHRWPILFLALGLLVGEWGIRRWKGLP
ncbi:MAG: putative membrane protein [Mariniblastus sp.]|jgi:uncharacterized membrane protein